MNDIEDENFILNHLRTKDEKNEREKAIDAYVDRLFYRLDHPPTTEEQVERVMRMLKETSKTNLEGDGLLRSADEVKQTNRIIHSSY